MAHVQVLDDLVAARYAEDVAAGAVAEADDRLAMRRVDGLASMRAPGTDAVGQDHDAPASPRSEALDPVQDAPTNAPASSLTMKGSYPAPAERPTQLGPEGILFDFNEGCRLLAPPRETGAWRARLRDLDTGNILFETETKGGLIRSAKRWHVRFGV